MLNISHSPYIQIAFL